MKTIKELKDEGLMSARLYRALLRGICFDRKFLVIRRDQWGLKEFDFPNGNELTINDVLELWSEKEILHWRGIGKTSFEELKSLA